MIRCFLVLVAALHVFNAEAFVQNGISSPFKKFDDRQQCFPAHAHSRRKSDASSLRCMQPSDSQSDDVFGSLFKKLFPSAEERRKEEVRRRRKWMPKPTSHTPEPPKQDSSPAVSKYVPPEQSESGKVDIGIHAN